MTRSERLGASVLKVLWFFVIPALVAAILVGRFTAVRAAAIATPGLSPIFERYPALLGVAVFVVTSGIVRYWRARLPGGHHLVALVPTKTAQKARKRWSSMTSLIVSVALAAGAALLLRAQVGKPYRVLSASMLPSLEPGEYVAARSTSAGPRRGDVVVFRREVGRGVDELTKRVIGLSGDRISMRGGFPVINGWEVPHCDAGRYVFLTQDHEVNGRLYVEFLDERSYLTVHTAGSRPALEYDVRAGEVFVLGDNRSESEDSRFWSSGKPSGLRIPDIQARVDFSLFKTHRDKTLDLRPFLKAPGDDLHLEGLNVSGLSEGIERCLKQRPPSTPPAPQRPKS